MTILKTTINSCKSSKHGNSLEPARQIIEEDRLVGFISRGHDNKPIGVKHTTSVSCRRKGCMPPFIVSDITLTKRVGIIAFIHVLFEMGLQYVANNSVIHKGGTLI